MKVLAREDTGDVVLSEAFNPSSEGRQLHFQLSVLQCCHRRRLSSIFSSTSHAKALVALSSRRSGLDVPSPI